MYYIQYFYCILLSVLLTLFCVESSDFIFKTNLEITDGIHVAIDALKPSSHDIAYYEEVVLPSYSANTIYLKNIKNKEFGFGVLQVHAFQYNITLSYNRTIQKHFSENGTNLGFNIYPYNEYALIYVYNYNYFIHVNASIVFMIYNKRTPVPGACDSVYDAPILKLTPKIQFMYIDTPSASTDLSDPLRELCNSNLSYIGYHLFLRRADYSCRTYFDGIKKMLTADSAHKNGQLGALLPSFSTRRSYISIPGTGTVFVTVVVGSNGRATYIPVYTISCTPPFWETGCNIFGSPELRMLSGILIVVGVIRAYGGDFLFFVGAAVDGFIIGVYASFYALYNWIDSFSIPEDAELSIMIASGIFVGLIFFGVYFLAPPLTWVFQAMTSLIVGFLMASFITYVFNNINLTSSTFWYEVLFIGCIIAVLILLPPCYNVSGIVLNAALGSFSIIQGILFIGGGHLNYVVVNTLRNIYVKDYRLANTTPNLTTEDVLYIVFWFILFVSAVIFRYKKTTHSRTYEVISDERAPLISRWTQGSDDVFESPISNYRFISRFRGQRSHVNNIY